MSKAAKKKKSKTPNTEKGVVKIQYLFRKKYQKLQKNKKSLYMIYQTQLQLMYRVQSQFHNSVYTQEKYNKLMHQLEKCSQEYQKLLETEPNLKNLSEKNTQHNLFINKLLNITIEIGLELKYLLPLFSQDKNSLSPLQKFYHTFYIPTTCHRLLYPCSGVEGSLGYRVDTSLHSNLEVSIKKKPPATSILSKKKKTKRQIPRI